MKYKFAFYTNDYFNQIEQMILDSYSWEYPIFGLSRFEFSTFLHPYFIDMHNVWNRTCGLWFDGKKLVGCAINEANDEGDAFFLFDCQSRSEDKELIEEMIFFAKTTMSVFSEASLPVNWGVSKRRSSLTKISSSLLSISSASNGAG